MEIKPQQGPMSGEAGCWTHGWKGWMVVWPTQICMMKSHSRVPVLLSTSCYLRDARTCSDKLLVCTEQQVPLARTTAHSSCLTACLAVLLPFTTQKPSCKALKTASVKKTVENGLTSVLSLQHSGKVAVTAVSNRGTFQCPSYGSRRSCVTCNLDWIPL